MVESGFEKVLDLLSRLLNDVLVVFILLVKKCKTGLWAYQEVSMGLEREHWVLRVDLRLNRFQLVVEGLLSRAALSRRFNHQRFVLLRVQGQRLVVQISE